MKIPGQKYSQRINTTFDTGPDLLVRAVQEDLGIPIDHYVEVNFDSFRQIVNAVGGVQEYFPTPARDDFSDLVIKSAGCVNLSGDQALQFVRSRHYEYYANGRWHFEAESDLARIRRQQSFIKKMISKAQSTGLTNPLKLNGIVAGVTTNLTVDKGFSQSLMLSLAKRFKSVSPTSIASSTLPADGATVQGNDVLLIRQPDAANAIAQFLGQPAPTASSTSTAAVPAGLRPSQVTVQVLNGTGQPGQAGKVETAMRAVGFVVTGVGTAPSLSNPTTVVRYGPGNDGKAALVASSIVGGAQLQADATLTGGYARRGDRDQLRGHPDPRPGAGADDDHHGSGRPPPPRHPPPRPPRPTSCRAHLPASCRRPAVNAGRLPQARLIGASDRSRCFSPTEGKRTTASALSPVPLTSRTTPFAPFGVDDVFARAQAQAFGARSPHRRRPAAAQRRLDDALPAPKAAAAAIAPPADGAVASLGHVDQGLGDLLQEPARRVVLGLAPQAAAPGVGQVQPLLGPGDADIGQAALLLELVGVAERAQMGEDAVLHAEQEDDRVLEALGRVQGHEHDLARCRRRGRRSRPPG